MWRIMCAFDMPYSATSPYECYPELYDDDTMVPLPLDPIDPAIVGKVNLTRLRMAAAEGAMFLPFALKAIDILVNPSSLRELLEEIPTVPRIDAKLTMGRFREHLEQLRRWGVIERAKSIKFLSRYFAIPKNDEFARSIFNGRLLSRFFAVPGPVNLPYIPIIIRLIMDLDLSRGLHATSADIRHWFHQIPVGYHLKEYFGVALSAKEPYRWRVLPMGWSHSPRICQSLAWTAILHKSKQVPDALDAARKEIRGLEDPPQYVRLTVDGVTVGYVTLTYDNIGIFCVDHDVFGSINAQIRENLKYFNIVEKEWITTPSNHMSLPRDVVEVQDFEGGSHYLGVQFAVNKRRLHWRTSPSRVTKWQAVESGLRDEALCISPRWVARAVGIILWCETIALRPLCNCTAAMECLRLAGQHARSRKGDGGWDAEWPDFPMGLRRDLYFSLQNCIKNPWISATKTVARKPVTIFTDASDEGLGAVLCKPQQTPVVLSGSFEGSLKTSHIYYKELAAAVFATMKIIAEEQLNDTEILLVGDNSACYFALGQFFSSSPVACKWLASLYNVLQRSCCTLRVAQVPSAMNPADAPSRNKVFQPRLLTVAMEAVERLTRGILSEQENQYVRVLKEIRHSDVVAESEPPQASSSEPSDDASEDSNPLLGQLQLDICPM